MHDQSVVHVYYQQAIQAILGSFKKHIAKLYDLLYQSYIHQMIYVPSFYFCFLIKKKYSLYYSKVSIQWLHCCTRIVKIAKGRDFDKNKSNRDM